MFIYIVITIILILGTLVKEEYSKKVFTLSFVFIFFITAFRNPNLGGLDAVYYQRFFSQVPTLSDLSNYKSPYTIGYTVLNSTVKTLGGDYISFQIVYSILVFILLWIIIDKLELKEKQKCLFLFSYFCFRFIWNTWVTYRQNIANLFFWLFIILCFKEVSVKYKKNRGKKSKKILFYSILAMLVPPFFHTSAWVNIFVVPFIFLLQRIKVSIKMIVVLVMSIILYSFGSSLYSIFIHILITKIDVRYSVYGLEITANSNVVNYLFRLFFFLLICTKIKSLKHCLLPMFINTMTLMVIVGSINAELVTRMYEYYAIGLYGCMSLFLKIFTPNSRIFVTLIYYFVMLAILTRFLIITDDGFYLHYSLFSF